MPGDDVAGSRRRRLPGLGIASGGLTYTNRHGRVHHLSSVETASGQRRYVAAVEPRGTPLRAIPPGYIVAENVNGQVSLRRDVPVPITAAHLATVRAALDHEPRLAVYRLEARGRTLVVHEPVGLEDGQGSRRRRGLAEVALAHLAARARHRPVLRFILVKGEQDEFTVERWCYLAGYEGWRPMHAQGPLAALVARYVPHLGTDTLFELLPD